MFKLCLDSHNARAGTVLPYVIWDDVVNIGHGNEGSSWFKVNGLEVSLRVADEKRGKGVWLSSLN